MSECWIAEFREKWLAATRGDRYSRLEPFVSAVPSDEQHDYNGPTATDRDGIRHPVPDPVHERFHKAVGDVIAGRVIPAARKQMEDALKRTPPEPSTSASTGKAMPDKSLGTGGDPRRIGA